MFDTWLRGLKDRLLAPWLRHVRRVRPNHLTILAFAVGVAGAGAAWRRHYVLSLLLWVANRTIDGVDGTLARVQGTGTDFGGYLDIVLDFVVYALVPLGVVAGAPSVRALFGALAMIASFYVNAASWMYLAAILERRHALTRDRAVAIPGVSGDATTVVMPPSLVAGAETVVLYCLLLAFPERAVMWFELIAALVVVTIVHRVVWARRAIGGAT